MHRESSPTCACTPFRGHVSFFPVQIMSRQCREVARRESSGKEAPKLVQVGRHTTQGKRRLGLSLTESRGRAKPGGFAGCQEHRLTSCPEPAVGLRPTTRAAAHTRLLRRGAPIESTVAPCVRALSRLPDIWKNRMGLIPGKAIEPRTDTFLARPYLPPKSHVGYVPHQSRSSGFVLASAYPLSV